MILEQSIVGHFGSGKFKLLPCQHGVPKFVVNPAERVRDVWILGLPLSDSLCPSQSRLKVASLFRQEVREIVGGDSSHLSTWTENGSGRLVSQDHLVLDL